MYFAMLQMFPMKFEIIFPLKVSCLINLVSLCTCLKIIYLIYTMLIIQNRRTILIIQYRSTILVIQNRSTILYNKKDNENINDPFTQITSSI